MQCAEQRRQQRGGSGTGRPHDAETEPDLFAAIAPVGMFRHDGGRQHVVGADADAEDEADADQAPQVRAKACASAMVAISVTSRPWCAADRR